MHRRESLLGKLVVLKVIIMHECYTKDRDSRAMITSGYGFVMNKIGFSSGNIVFLGYGCCVRRN
jgi:hypothetical protein